MDIRLKKQKLINKLNIHFIKLIRDMLNFTHPFHEKELLSRIRKSEEDITGNSTILLTQVRAKYK